MVHDQHKQTKTRTPANDGFSPVPTAINHDVAYGYPRDFLDNQFVYLVISPRAGGLSIGINVNPIVTCNFHCIYCEVDRARPARVSEFEVERMEVELDRTIHLAETGLLRQLPRYSRLPPDLLKVRHVALSGDGEPTLAAHFVETVRAVTHVRALRGTPFLKIVLLTNSSALDRPQVQQGLELLTREDEVWAKLEAGTQAYFERINGTALSLDSITENILTLARRRPVVIQSLFPAIDGAEPPVVEVEKYAQRLKWLKDAGAQIPLVQIYSATRPMARVGGGYLPLKALSNIARTVRQIAGLRAEVF